MNDTLFSKVEVYHRAIFLLRNRNSPNINASRCKYLLFLGEILAIS